MRIPTPSTRLLCNFAPSDSFATHCVPPCLSTAHQLLDAIPTLHAEFSLAEIDTLIDASMEVTYPAKTIIFMEGLVGTRTLHIITRGSAHCTVTEGRATRMRRRSSATLDDTGMLAAFAEAPDRRGSSPAIRRASQLGEGLDMSSQTVLQDLHVGDHFGMEAFLSLSTDAAGESYVPRYTVQALSQLHCLCIDKDVCGPLYDRMLFVLTREFNGWRWAIANRNKLHFNDLTPVRTIGVGTYGTVKMVLHRERVGRQADQRTTVYALKMVERKSLKEKRLVVQLERERELLQVSAPTPRQCSPTIVLAL